MPDPLSNIYIEKGFETGQDVLSCLHRIRQLLQVSSPVPACCNPPYAEFAVGMPSSGVCSAVSMRGLVSWPIHELGSFAGGIVPTCFNTIFPDLQRPGPRPVRLIVIDSIAHVFRDVGDKPGVSELAGRTEILFRLSAMLR